MVHILNINKEISESKTLSGSHGERNLDDQRKIKEASKNAKKRKRKSKKKRRK